jgi:archaellum biogenesis ATPase FlaH
MNTIQLEKIAFHTVLKEKTYLGIVKPTFFETPNYGELYDLASRFATKYNEAPTKEQVVELVKLRNLGQKISREFVDALYDIQLNSYESEWLQESVEAWIEFKKLDTSVESLITYLKTTKISTDNVKQVVENAKDIIISGTNIDLKFDEGLDFFNPASHNQPTYDTFSTGYTYLDLVLGGGWSTKSLYVIAGEQKIGKSIWLANLAANAIRLGNNAAMITLEMKDKHVVKRLGANILNTTMKDYNTFANDPDMVRKKLSTVGMDELRTPGQFYVKEYPTSTASIKDIERYLVKMEQIKGIKFKIIFIDYLNIMSNWRNPNSEQTYMKIKQIAEDTRAMGIKNNWAIVSLTQLNRTAFGASGAISISSIAESSGLGHTVDWLGGIIQDEIMHANCEYMLQTMLNRNEGLKNSKKKFLIDYNHMRLTEDLNSQIITDVISY